MERISDVPIVHQEHTLPGAGGGQSEGSFEGAIAETFLTPGGSVHDAPTPAVWAARDDYPGSPFATGELSEMSPGDDLPVENPREDSPPAAPAEATDDIAPEITFQEETPAETFGAYLRRLREEKGLTQEEVTSRFGQSSAHRLRQIEKSACHPPQGAIVRIMEIIGVDADEIASTLPSYNKERDHAQAERTTDAPENETKAPADDSRLPPNRAMLRLLAEQGIGADLLLPPRAHGRKGRDPELAQTLLEGLAAGVSYDEIAAQTGCSAATVRRYEGVMVKQIHTNADLAELVPAEMLHETPGTQGRFQDIGYRGIGWQLRAAAKIKQVRIADVADRTGASVETIMRLHNGSVKPHPWVVSGYAATLGMDHEEVEAVTQQYAKKEYQPHWEQVRQQTAAANEQRKEE